MDKILLIGGNGFIGQAVYRKLDPAQTWILGKKKLSSQANYLQADLLDLTSLIEALSLEKFTHIVQSVQFAGHPVERPWLGAEYTYLGLDATATQNILKALEYLDLKKEIKQYIYLSGAGAGDLSSQYNWTKAKQIAEKALQNSGLDYTILRPSWVYGKGDRSLSKFIFFAKYLPVFPLIGDGQSKVNPIWVEDLAEIIHRSLGNPASYQQIYELGSLELTMKEVASIVLKQYGQNKLIMTHPKALMKLIGLFTQFFPFSPISPGSVDFLTMKVQTPNLQQKLWEVSIRNLPEGLAQAY